VPDHVLELCGRVRDGQRDRNPAGPPDPPLDRDVVKARRGEKRDPGLREVVAPGEQARGDAGRGVQQIAICEGAYSGDDGRPVTVPPRPCDEGQLAQGRASITSRATTTLYRRAWSAFSMFWPTPSSSSATSPVSVPPSITAVSTAAACGSTASIRCK